MPSEAPGLRHEAVATKACQHGQIVTEDNIVGTAFQVDQLNRFVDPTEVDGPTGFLIAHLIAIGQDFNLVIGGLHDAPLEGGLVGADIGDMVWIRAGNNALSVGPPAGTNEVQTETVTATGGTRTISFDGETTIALGFGALAATIQAALEGLSNVDPGDIVVSGTGPFVYTFGGRYAGENVPALVVNTGSLTGGSSSFATTTGGVDNPTALPVGIITEIDASRDPEMAKINSNYLGAFFAATVVP